MALSYFLQVLEIEQKSFGQFQIPAKPNDSIKT
jgi:hypothetical protein